MPHIVVIAGPNGAGKTTSAPALLRDMLGVYDYVNADAIAQGFSGFRPEQSSAKAGRLALDRLRELSDKNADFAFESTLSGRTLATLITDLKRRGYSFHISFLWLPSADLAVARVAERVRKGGHYVPEESVRRRYDRGIRNFFNLYQPIANHWRFYDASVRSGPRPVARGAGQRESTVLDLELWREITMRWRHG